MEKHHRSELLGNVLYMLKNWYRWHRQSFLYLAARIPALIAVPMLTAFIPKVMMDCMTERAGIGELVWKIALLSLSVAGASWVAPFMQQKLGGAAQILRMRYAVLSFRKTMTADFVDLESLEGRERLERSKTFINGNYSGAQAFCDVTCQIAQGLFGILTSALLLNRLPFFMLLLIVLTCLGEFLLHRLEYRADRKTREARNGLYVKFDYFFRTSHDFGAGKDIRLYNLSDWFLKITADVLAAYSRVIKKFLHVTYSLTGARALISALRDGIAYFFLISAVLNDEITVSDFVFYYGIVTGFSGYVSLLTFQYNQLIRCSLECSKFREYTEREEEGDLPKPHIQKTEECNIEFRDVHFRYRDSEAETVKGMSFTVKSGENIAIVGENGAGKTTAIKLLCGLYKITDGEILLNGENISRFSQSSYFDLFSVVFQDYRFLPVSVAKNVALCEEENIDSEKLWDCLEKAGIGEKIRSLPHKENSLMNKAVYKNAVDFSGGEKQKLLLARALYKDAPILILDEPTAALDPIAENELYLKYNSLSENKVSFFISHRLSSTRFCDKILFLSGGVVAETGTHEELMAKKGKYYRMYNMQSYYYREEAGEL